MIWRAVIQWLMAGCLGATAMNFSAGTDVSSAHLLPPASYELLEPSEVPQESAPSLPAETFSSANFTPGEPAAKAGGPEDYTIQPADLLEISVFQEKDLDTKVRVSSTGEINFPLLGRVEVAGLTVTQVQEKVQTLLERDFLVNPQVQVFISSYHDRRVYVSGAVGKPGSYALPIGKPTTLMEAITMAGGFSEQAAANGTRIVRIEKGKEMVIKVRAGDIVKKGDKSQDVEVRANDVVFVPESFF